MLDPRVIDTARRLVNGQLQTRQQNYERQLLNAQSELVRRGMLGSGNAVYQLAEVAKEELRSVAATVWTELKRALDAMPPTVARDLEGDVDAAFKTLFGEQKPSVIALLQSKLALTRINASGQGVTMADGFSVAILQQYSAEISLWAAAYESAQRTTSGTAPASYHFSGPVASVQTGAASTAHVVQNIADAEMVPVIDALNRLTEEFAAMAELSPKIRSDLVSLNTTIEQELRAPEPNRITLKGLFNGLSTFVQTLAATPATYAVLESAARAVGLM